MLSEKELGLLYETLLSAPGMADTVKLDIRITRKDVLILSKMIVEGLQASPGEALAGLFKASGKESKDVLLQVSQELLEKAGLSDMNSKLTSLQPSGK